MQVRSSSFSPSEEKQEKKRRRTRKLFTDGSGELPRALLAFGWITLEAVSEEDPIS
jgi:hypothetical protein